MKRTKRLLAAILSCAMVFALTACGGSDGTADGADSGSLKAIPKEDLKIGFVYVGPVGDEGYSYAHDQGRKKMMENLGLSEDQVIHQRECAGKRRLRKALNDMVDQGCNVIFSTSYGFMDFTLNVAKQHPDVYFFHCSGYKTADNMSAYFGRMYEMRYLSGIGGRPEDREQQDRLCSGDAAAGSDPRHQRVYAGRALGKPGSNGRGEMDQFLV